MKFLAVLALFVFAVLFVVGFLMPGRSRRVEASLDRRTRRGERKADDRAGRLGDATRKGLELFRRGGDRSVQAGRQVRDKSTPD